MVRPTCVSHKTWLVFILFTGMEYIDDLILAMPICFKESDTFCFVMYVFSYDLKRVLLIRNYIQNIFIELDYIIKRRTLLIS